MKYIELTKGYRTIVDDEDYEYLNQWRWCYARGYVMRRVYTGTGRKDNRGYGVYLHNLVIKPSEGMIIDHISRDGLDNRKCNLRECTLQQNTWNRGLAGNNKSGFKGVSFNKPTKRWKARIALDGIDKHIGYYATKEEAAKAYNEMAKIHYGEYAYLNKV